MKLREIYNITFDIDETIITATLSKSNEIVGLTSLGNIIKFNLDNQKTEKLFSVKNNIGYTDGGFDLTSKSSIYTIDEIIVVVNDFKRHGFVYYPNKYNALHLWRQDYHANISTYPIALYRDERGEAHLIYGENWNHIQIMNLETLQILTASKSLIEENIEETYKKYNIDNKLPWPMPYDYFYGKLLLSPNQKKFLSAGWDWGSCDSYNVYDIENFITNNRISVLRIDQWEHENRPICWVDDDTIAVGYSPYIDGDDNSTIDTPCEIHFYKVNDDNAEKYKKIQIDDKDILKSKIFFSTKMNLFFIISQQKSLSIASLDGDIVYKNENIEVEEYNDKNGLFLGIDNKTILVYEIVK